MKSRWRAHWIWLGVGLVLAWRWAAFLWPHPADTDPKLLRDLLALLGLCFVACGVWVALAKTSAAGCLFTGYCLASGVHWGGPVGIDGAWDEVLRIVYVGASTALASGLLVHLALVYPRPQRKVPRPSSLILVYMPACVAGLLCLGAIAIPSRADWSALVLLLFPIAVLYGFVAGGLWFRQWFGASPAERSLSRLNLIAGSLIAGWLPHGVISALGPLLGDWDGLFNLFFAMIPIGLARALTDSNRGAA